MSRRPLNSRTRSRSQDRTIPKAARWFEKSLIDPAGCRFHSLSPATWEGLPDRLSKIHKKTPLAVHNFEIQQTPDCSLPSAAYIQYTLRVKSKTWGCPTGLFPKESNMSRVITAYPGAWLALVVRQHYFRVTILEGFGGAR